MSTDFRTLKFKGADILSWIDEHVPGFVNTYDVCTYLKQNGKYIALELHAAGKSYKDNNEYTVVTYPWSYVIKIFTINVSFWQGTSQSHFLSDTGLSLDRHRKY